MEILQIPVSFFTGQLLSLVYAILTPIQLIRGNTNMELGTIIEHIQRLPKQAQTVLLSELKLTDANIHLPEPST